MNRREMLAALSASALLLQQDASAAQDQPRFTESHVYQFDDLKRVHLPNGQEDQIVLNGEIATGERLEVHETTLPPGQMPHASHHHKHSELMLVRSGTLEFDNNGTKTTAGPGSVFFVGSNVPHAVKCVGDVAANYFVIAIGRD